MRDTADPGTDVDGGTPGYQTDHPDRHLGPRAGGVGLPGLRRAVRTRRLQSRRGASSERWLVRTSSTAWTPLGSGSLASKPFPSGPSETSTPPSRRRPPITPIGRRPSPPPTTPRAAPSTGASPRSTATGTSAPTRPTPSQVHATRPFSGGGAEQSSSSRSPSPAGSSGTATASWTVKVRDSATLNVVQGPLGPGVRRGRLVDPEDDELERCREFRLSRHSSGVTFRVDKTGYVTVSSNAA